MYRGSRLNQTRPGSPIPGIKVVAWLVASNSGDLYGFFMPNLDAA